MKFKVFDNFGPKEFSLSELNVKDYILLQKIIINNNEDQIIDFVSNNLLDLNKNRCVFQFIYECLSFREAFIGDELKITIQQNLKTQKADYVLNIKNFKQNVLKEWETFFSKPKPVPLFEASSWVSFQAPTLFEILNNIYQPFIRTIKNNDGDVIYLTRKESDVLLKTIPAKIAKEVIFFQKQATIKNINLLPGALDNAFNVTISKQGIVEFIKLIFGTDLTGIYDAFYTLASEKNININYLQEISPAELMIYIKKIEIEREKQNQNETPNREFLVEDVGE